jgi:uncharacterized membrane protein
MNEIPTIIGLAIMAIAIDLPWIYLQGPTFTAIVRDIQVGSPMNVRLLGLIPIYLAVGYLASQVDSAHRAFLTGLAVYAIYDFTQIVTFDKYPFWFAIVDSLWGGLLMLLVWWAGSILS